MDTDEIQQIQSELHALGYETLVRESDQGTVVEFDYRVEAGACSGHVFRVGVSFHRGRTGYPEYPPHWIHVSPPVCDGHGRYQKYRTASGQEWVALSRPPKDIWDLLQDKNMKSYMNEHMRRFWNGI